MNNFKIFFKETTTLEINGEHITFLKGKSVAFRNISNKDTTKIRKACIKGDNMIFSMTDDTYRVYKVVYGNKNAGVKNTVDNTVKLNKGSKKDKFKNYTPKENSHKTINLDESEKGVKITQNSLTEEPEKEIIDTEVKIDEEL